MYWPSYCSPKAPAIKDDSWACLWVTEDTDQVKCKKEVLAGHATITQDEYEKALDEGFKLCAERAGLQELGARVSEFARFTNDTPFAPLVAELSGAIKTSLATHTKKTFLGSNVNQLITLAYDMLSKRFGLADDAANKYTGPTVFTVMPQITKLAASHKVFEVMLAPQGKNSALADINVPGKTGERINPDLSASIDSAELLKYLLLNTK
jgi:hypothetical protein